MIALDEDILVLMSGLFWHTAIVFLRVGALVSLLPAFGERTVPARVKLALAIMFTLIVAPGIPPIEPPPEIQAMSGFVISETIVGLALGLGIRLFVLALQTAGSIAAQATSLAQILGGAAAEPIPAMGYVLVIAGLALAVMSGLHVQAAALLIQSYSWFLPGQMPDASWLSSWGATQVSNAFSLAFTLALPFVIASLIYNLTLGVINRAMPQLMVAFVGAPLITWGGLFLLFVSAPIILTVWVAAIGDFMSRPDRLPG